MKKQSMLLLLFFDRRHFCLALLFLFVGISGSQAQCFSSSGNPVGGNQNVGILGKDVWTLMGFGRYGYFDRYFEGDQPSGISILKNADYSYTGTLIGYGLTRKISLEAELGYFIQKTKRYAIPEGYSLRGYGLSNGVLSAKMGVYQNIETDFSWSLGAGIKFPFSRSLQAVDNVRLPFDIQPSTGAFGIVLQSFLVKQNSFSGMRYFLFNRLDMNGQSREGYHYGLSMVNSVFISRHLVKTSSWPVSFTLIMQLRNEYRDYNSIRDVTEISSGSMKFFACPQINMAVNDVWNFSLMLDLPVYQYYNHIQLAESYSLGVSLTRILTPY